MSQTEKKAVGIQSLLLAVVGLILMATGAELFLSFSESLGSGRWIPLTIALGGILIISLGIPLKREERSGWWLRLGGVILFSCYFTVSAFLRYPGLSKDIAPTALNVTFYFGKVLLALALLVLFTSIPRLLYAWHHDSHTR